MIPAYDLDTLVVAVTYPAGVMPIPKSEWDNRRGRAVTLHNAVSGREVQMSGQWCFAEVMTLAEFIEEFVEPQDIGEEDRPWNR